MSCKWPGEGDLIFQAKYVFTFLAVTIFGANRGISSQGLLQVAFDIFEVGLLELSRCLGNLQFFFVNMASILSTLGR